MSYNSGSNNIHYNMPPMMNDGRNYSTWEPESIVNSKIQKKEVIKSNWEYRQYLQNNANNIIKFIGDPDNSNIINGYV